MTAELVEYRYCELRHVGDRVVQGTVVRFGDVARMPWGKEVVLPGAIEQRSDVALNYFHIREYPLARTGGGGLEININSEAVELRAEIADTSMGNDALALVRKGVLCGFSMEFRAELDTYEGDLRKIEKAVLRGIGLVDKPAYPSSLIEARMSDRVSRFTRGKMGAALWPFL